MAKKKFRIRWFTLRVTPAPLAELRARRTAVMLLGGTYTAFALLFSGLSAFGSSHCRVFGNAFQLDVLYGVTALSTGLLFGAIARSNPGIWKDRMHDMELPSPSVLGTESRVFIVRGACFGVAVRSALPGWEAPGGPIQVLEACPAMYWSTVAVLPAAVLGMIILPFVIRWAARRGTSRATTFARRE